MQPYTLIPPGRYLQCQLDVPELDVHGSLLQQTCLEATCGPIRRGGTISGTAAGAGRRGIIDGGQEGRRGGRGGQDGGRRLGRGKMNGTGEDERMKQFKERGPGPWPDMLPSKRLRL